MWWQAAIREHKVLLCSKLRQKLGTSAGRKLTNIFRVKLPELIQAVLETDR